MAVGFVIRRVKQSALFIRGRGGDLCCWDNPNAHALFAAGVYIACVLEGMFCVGGMQAAHMPVRQAMLPTNKDFPQGPFAGHISTRIRNLHIFPELSGWTGFW